MEGWREGGREGGREGEREREREREKRLPPSLGSSFYVWAAQKTGSHSVRWGQHEMASRPPPTAAEERKMVTKFAKFGSSTFSIILIATCLRSYIIF